ncbi:MAG: 23S rRNA (adenine(2503)-C(2))-methyltransferase RlmN [bacterium]|nr:23S rRNA (adenine(2503)-C(2))-methyltransferase RlmN [bacterium]
MESLLDLSIDALQTEMALLGAPKYTAKQIWGWMYQKQVTTYDQMSNIKKSIREALAAKYTLLPFSEHYFIGDDDDLAIKYIFKIDDHNSVEAVVLSEKDYKTLCISSQCGCPVDCKFCLTGVAGFKRNLTVGEIVGQLLVTMSEGHPITHIVFMGMGEPLLNYDNVIAAYKRFTEESSFNLSGRKITISTSGYIRNIEQLITDDIHLNLAFSVGSANPLIRESIMPIEKRNPIVKVARLLKQYLKLHNRKLTLEYTLLKGVNDTKDQIIELGNLAQYLDAKVNLINLNPHERIPFSPVDNKVLTGFKNLLLKSGVRATIRYTKGQEIVAACGQLGESILTPKTA